MNRERNVGTQVRAALPAGLADKLAETEAALGRPVTFLADGSLRGNARGSANADAIRLAPQHIENLNVVGEEIMHLHRRTRGYPLIEPLAPARRLGFDSALLRLGGHFDEVAFFPFLEGLGLNPRGELSQSLAAEIEALQTLMPTLIDGNYDPAVLIELAVVYVRAAMLAPEGGPEQRALLRLFDDLALAEFRDIGRALCVEIDAVKDASPDDVEESMHRCVRLLRVTDAGATVRTFNAGATAQPNRNA